LTLKFYLNAKLFDHIYAENGLTLLEIRFSVIEVSLLLTPLVCLLS